MYIWFDAKGKEECITTALYDCSICTRSCELIKCPQRFNKTGKNILHTGYLGSAMTRLLALDLNEVKTCIKNAQKAALSCDSSLSEEQKYQIWLNEFESLRSMIGDQSWNLYEQLETLDELFTSLVMYPPNVNDYLGKRLKSAFIEAECMQSYIDHCCSDRRWFDIDRFLTVDKSFFANDDIPVTVKALNVAGIKYPLASFRVNQIPSVEAFLDLVSGFIDNEQEMPCTVDISRFSTVYECFTLDDLLRVSLFEVIKSGLKVKKCANCGKPFIPQKRSDTIYCDRPAPQKTDRSCREYGADKAYQNNLRKKASMQLYRKIYMSKQMRTKRNPDIVEYSESFEKFKSQSKQWKAEVKAGAKTEEEFIEWLKSVKEKKVL